MVRQTGPSVLEHKLLGGFSLQLHLPCWSLQLKARRPQLLQAQKKLWQIILFPEAVNWRKSRKLKKNIYIYYIVVMWALNQVIPLKSHSLHWLESWWWIPAVEQWWYICWSCIAPSLLDWSERFLYPNENSFLLLTIHELPVQSKRNEQLSENLSSLLSLKDGEGIVSVEINSL